MPKQKRILIVRTDRVGDVVVMTPMIRELKLAFPDSFIGAMTNVNNSQILDNNPYLDCIIKDDLKKESFWQIVKTIRSYKFTDALLVLPTERAAYQLFFAGIKNRVGVGRILYEVITFMKSVSRNNYIPLRHEADYSMDLARKIGVVTDNLQPEIFLSGTDRNNANKFFIDNNISLSAHKIILHTGSKGSGPNWCEDKYLEFLPQMLPLFGGKEVTVLLTALEMSESFAKQAVKIGNGKVIDISKKINTLRDMISIIGQSNLVISNSTGPMHIASGLQMNSIALFCRRPMSCVKRWGAISPNAVNLEVTEENCNKYCNQANDKCGFDNAMPIDIVLDAVKRNINK